MTALERSIRRDLRRAAVPVHLRRRTARRLAVQAHGAALADAMDTIIEAEARRRADRLGGDLQAARAARKGAEVGESVALGFLVLGRQIGAAVDRLQTHLNGRTA
ncbi:hypothetical protein [Methylobacterium sp. J-076]|uniref:hypothetical protein n=1 Tax=Methylobacterium sp. J-076 TaxID=2836655 RepID=UPI001FBA6071|nr:hypothetical protein [Methylobacterium sp. J-076]MCJ2015533.1 hypothetical protein [Methylobacterium sp. J-076]